MGVCRLMLNVRVAVGFLRVCECLILGIYTVACVVNEVSMKVEILITNFEWDTRVTLGVKIRW